jgi:integrating conjugative element protein (TIGR03765 family)
LTPGRVERRALDLNFARPFFLIGADSLSRRWLKARRAELRRVGAVGMLVQAETVDDLRLVAELADGLPILPAPASDIAAALGLSHYPVLISNQGIEQ